MAAFEANSIPVVSKRDSRKLKTLDELAFRLAVSKTTLVKIRDERDIEPVSRLGRNPGERGAPPYLYDAKAFVQVFKAVQAERA